MNNIKEVFKTASYNKDVLHKRVEEMVGHTVNLDKPVEVSNLLYDELGYKLALTDKGGHGTGKRHFIDLISQCADSFTEYSDVVGRTVDGTEVILLTGKELGVSACPVALLINKYRYYSKVHSMLKSIVKEVDSTWESAFETLIASTTAEEVEFSLFGNKENSGVPVRTLIKALIADLSYVKTGNMSPREKIELVMTKESYTEFLEEYSVKKHLIGDKANELDALIERCHNAIEETFAEE